MATRDNALSLFSSVFFLLPSFLWDGSIALELKTISFFLFLLLYKITYEHLVVDDYVACKKKMGGAGGI
jgi:hypothetical protein